MKQLKVDRVSPGLEPRCALPEWTDQQLSCPAVWHHANNESEQTQYPTQPDFRTNWRAFFSCLPAWFLSGLTDNEAQRVSRNVNLAGQLPRSFSQNKTCFRLRVAAIRHPGRWAAVWSIDLCATITKEDNRQTCKWPRRYRLKWFLLLIFTFFFSSVVVNRHRLVKN